MSAPGLTPEQWDWLTRGLVAAVGAAFGWLARHFWKRK